MGHSVGCEPSPKAPHIRSIAALVAEKWPIFQLKQKRNQSDDRRRYKDAPVYIDGRRSGVIRALEVPPSVRPRMRIRPGSPPAPRYSIAEYIAAEGADLPKVREVHLYGGRGRVTVVSGDEVRKHREDLFFLFTAGARGKPRIGWPTTGIEARGGSLDMVQAVAVYQEKEPPILNEKKGFLHFADGEPIDGIPYAPPEEVKGTRFYLDGVLSGWMKRKTLPNSVILPGAGLDSGLFSLRAFIESLGLDPAQVKAIELVQDDDAVARLDGKALTGDPPLAFQLPRRNQGNLVLLVPRKALRSPAPEMPEAVPIRVSAVQLFSKLAPPTRTYAKAADLIEPPDARDRRQGGGSTDDQGGP
ncbi:MAG: hypothetical protein R3B70_21175 [Polyangiaceae bacterium]